MTTRYSLIMSDVTFSLAEISPHRDSSWGNRAPPSGCPGLLAEWRWAGRGQTLLASEPDSLSLLTGTKWPLPPTCRKKTQWTIKRRGKWGMCNMEIFKLIIVIVILMMNMSSCSPSRIFVRCGCILMCTCSCVKRTIFNLKCRHRSIKCKYFC